MADGVHRVWVYGISRRRCTVARAGRISGDGYRGNGAIQSCIIDSHSERAADRDTNSIANCNANPDEHTIADTDTNSNGHTAADSDSDTDD